MVEHQGIALGRTTWNPTSTRSPWRYVTSIERSRSTGDGLGLESAGVVGTEFTGDDDTPAGAIALFRLEGELILSLYPRTELAKDADVPFGPPKSGEFSIGHLVATREDVDELLAQAEAAGRDAQPPGILPPMGGSTPATSATSMVTSGRSSGIPGSSAHAEQQSKTHPLQLRRERVKSTWSSAGSTKERHMQGHGSRGSDVAHAENQGRTGDGCAARDKVRQPAGHRIGSRRCGLRADDRWARPCLDLRFWPRCRPFRQRIRRRHRKRPDDDVQRHRDAALERRGARNQAARPLRQPARRGLPEGQAVRGRPRQEARAGADASNGAPSRSGRCASARRSESPPARTDGQPRSSWSPKTYSTESRISRQRVRSSVPSVRACGRGRDS